MRTVQTTFIPASQLTRAEGSVLLPSFPSITTTPSSPLVAQLQQSFEHTLQPRRGRPLISASLRQHMFELASLQQAIIETLSITHLQTRSRQLVKEIQAAMLSSSAIGLQQHSDVAAAATLGNKRPRGFGIKSCGPDRSLRVYDMLHFWNAYMDEQERLDSTDTTTAATAAAATTDVDTDGVNLVDRYRYCPMFTWTEWMGNNFNLFVIAQREDNNALFQQLVWDSIQDAFDNRTAASLLFAFVAAVTLCWQHFAENKHAVAPWFYYHNTQGIHVVCPQDTTDTHNGAFSTQPQLYIFETDEESNIRRWQKVTVAKWERIFNPYLQELKLQWKIYKAAVSSQQQMERQTHEKEEEELRMLTQEHLETVATTATATINMLSTPTITPFGTETFPPDIVDMLQNEERHSLSKKAKKQILMACRRVELQAQREHSKQLRLQLHQQEIKTEHENRFEKLCNLFIARSPLINSELLHSTFRNVYEYIILRIETDKMTTSAAPNKVFDIYYSEGEHVDHNAIEMQTPGVCVFRVDFKETNMFPCL